MEGNSVLPWFLFECGGTDDKKLSKVADALPEFRVIHVVDYDRLLRFWNGRETFPSISEIPLTEVKEWRERKRLVMRQRESMIPQGTEYWFMSVREQVPRILYAIRRGCDGRFTYLDSGEGGMLKNGVREAFSAGDDGFSSASFFWGTLRGPFQGQGNHRSAGHRSRDPRNGRDPSIIPE